MAERESREPPRMGGCEAANSEAERPPKISKSEGADPWPAGGNGEHPRQVGEAQSGTKDCKVGGA